MRRFSLLSPSLMGDMFEDFDRLMTSPSWSSSYDINQTDDHFVLSLDMPGVKAEDIKIEVQGNQLTVSGERKDRVGKFQRLFTLPDLVDTAKIEAHCENGVLTLAVPKAEKAKSRTIQVQTGQGGFLSKLLGGKKEEQKQLKDVSA